MKFLKNSITLFVLLAIVLILIPLPVFLLDFMFIINITISLVILLMTMYVKEALEFSIFPSLLLITTVFRLGLNLSSTRLILSNAGEAGAVIKTFGEFVLQGNVVIGFIVFLIIVLIQFIVITKGAERVAEVSARFTLDAMPGKQMSIDADLSSGIITEQEARERREKITREADFFGSMDGATKIVKGDSVMSLIITAINFIGGVIIGLVQGGMAFSEVLSVYSIATVGDGLVSQIPALLISTATGMIVTRSASEGSLNEDVSAQFITQPLVLIIAGISMLCVCFIPGMPKLQPIIVAAVLITGGTFLLRRQSGAAVQQTEEPVAEVSPYNEEEMDENTFYKDVNNVYSLLNIEPIEMEFGYSLIPYVDESSGGTFIDRIVIFRKQFALDMGFVVPSIRLRDSAMINPNQYVIKIMGDEVAKGELLVDYFLALEPSNPTGDIDGIEAIEPAYGIPSKWITEDKKDLAEIYGYTVIDPMSVMMTHLFEVIKTHAYELMTRAEVSQLLENLKNSSPELVDGIFPDIISHTTLQKVLQNLLKEGIPIKNLPTIIETLINISSTTKDVDIMTENVRTALKRTIVRKFCENGQLKVITLDAEVEKAIIASLNQNSQGIFLALSPEHVQSIMEQVKEHLTKFKDLSVMPVILTTPGIRIYFYRLIEQFYPNVYVLSFNEVDSNVQIQSLGNIRF